MGKWNVKELGLSSDNFGKDLSDAGFGMSSKWRFANQQQEEEFVPPVHKPQQEFLRAEEKNVDDRVEFSTPAMSAGVLNSMGIEQVKAVAAQLGISKLSRSSKDELIKAILQKQG